MSLREGIWGCEHKREEQNRIWGQGRLPWTVMLGCNPKKVLCNWAKRRGSYLHKDSVVCEGTNMFNGPEMGRTMMHSVVRKMANAAGWQWVTDDKVSKEGWTNHATTSTELGKFLKHLTDFNWESNKISLVILWKTYFPNRIAACLKCYNMRKHFVKPKALLKWKTS